MLPRLRAMAVHVLTPNIGSQVDGASDDLGESVDRLFHGPEHEQPPELQEADHDEQHHLGDRVVRPLQTQGKYTRGLFSSSAPHSFPAR